MGGQDAAAGNEQPFDWKKLGGAISSGASTFGNAYAQGQQDNTNYMRGSSYEPQPGQAPEQLPFTMIPQNSGTDIMAILQRLGIG